MSVKIILFLLCLFVYSCTNINDCDVEVKPEIYKALIKKYFPKKDLSKNHYLQLVNLFESRYNFQCKQINQEYFFSMKQQNLKEIIALYELWQSSESNLDLNQYLIELELEQESILNGNTIKYKAYYENGKLFINSL